MYVFGCIKAWFLNKHLKCFSFLDLKQQGSSASLNYSTFYLKPNSFQKFRLLVSEICAQSEMTTMELGWSCTYDMFPQAWFLKESLDWWEYHFLFFSSPNVSHIGSQTFQVEINPILPEIYLFYHTKLSFILCFCYLVSLAKEQGLE